MTMPKARTRTVSGEDPAIEPSTARRTKPPAKEISKRKHAALGSGGGRLPPRLREEFEHEGTDRRLRPARGEQATRSTRAGKRRPDQARFIETTEQHDRRPQRKSRTPESDPR
jgi:hypothetical protein